jgi:site-specific recombinase XerD
MQRYRKRKDGRYAKQITVGYKNGKPSKKTVYGKTIAELEKNYRELMLLVDRNVILDGQGITLSELMDEWYRINKQGKIRRNTECVYASLMKRIDVIGGMKVKDIRRYNIESLLSDIQKEGYTNTAKSVLGMLRNIFDYAISNDIIYKNPCLNLSVKHKAKAKRVLTNREKQIIENDIIDVKDKVFIYLLRYTGIRRGELFALEKNDIDRTNMTIHIRKTVIDNNGKPYIQDLTKTEAGDRYIPIFLRLAKPLFEYMDSVKGDLLFTNKKDKIMASNSMKVMFDGIAKKYSFEDELTMHCFRHNFISECYAAGVDIKKVQAWVGHDDVGTTLNIYTKLSKEEVCDGSVLNQYYGSQTEVKSQRKNSKTS